MTGSDITGSDITGSRTATGAIADFTSGLTRSGVPDAVWDKAGRALLHNLAVAVAGAPLAGQALRYADRVGALESGPSRLLTGGVRESGDDAALPMGQAAFTNAALMHARAQDDVYFPGLTHVGSTTIPAVLALAESLDSDADELRLALVAGYEAAATVSHGVAATTTARRFRATAIFGAVGAAAGCARLLGLDARATRDALGMAASMSGGTSQTWIAGTHEWQFQVGVAARTGLQCALLAASGGWGAPDALEGPAGFFAAFAGDAALTPSTGHLGSQWRIEQVTFKPYPVCAILQAPVVAAIGLRDQLDAPVATGSLTMTPPEAHYPGTEETGPFADVGGALMSAGFCLSVALERGTVTTADLLDHTDPRWLPAARRFAVVADDTLAERSFVLELTTASGRTARTEFQPDATTFNWDGAELGDQVRALGDQLPAGLDAEALIEACIGTEPAGARRLVDICLGAPAPSAVRHRTLEASP